MSLILITGPSRSGKSEYGEKIATNQQNPVIYIPTAQINPNDEEWQARIKAHQVRRPPHWQTLESPFLLTETLRSCPNNYCLLIDSLGTYVANFLEEGEEQWKNIQNELIVTLKNLPNQIIIIAEETGWGVIPAYKSGRQFRDRLGSVTRQIGAIADIVYLVVGGYALDLTKLGEKLDRK